MPNLVATDITVTVVNDDLTGGTAHKRRLVCKLAFGDSVLTYPSGGVPVSIGNLGCPNVIESLKVFDSGTSGYRWTYDTANKKLVAIQGASHTHDLLLKNAAVADSAGARVNSGTNLLGANTGTDLTVTGGGANGGVVLSGAVLGSQPSTVAITAQTLYCEVTGW